MEGRFLRLLFRSVDRSIGAFRKAPKFCGDILQKTQSIGGKDRFPHRDPPSGKRESYPRFRPKEETPIPMADLIRPSSPSPASVTPSGSGNPSPNGSFLRSEGDTRGSSRKDCWISWKKRCRDNRICGICGQTQEPTPPSLSGYSISAHDPIR